MHNVRVKFSIGKTYNTGNYQSLRLDVGMEADTPDDKIEESLTALKITVKRELEEQERFWKVLKS